MLSVRVIAVLAKPYRVLLFTIHALLLTDAPTTFADYRFIGRHSTSANDILCGQKDNDGKPQPFCKLCDDIGVLADACDNNPE